MLEIYISLKAAVVHRLRCISVKTTNLVRVIKSPLYHKVFPGTQTEPIGTKKWS